MGHLGVLWGAGVLREASDEFSALRFRQNEIFTMFHARLERAAAHVNRLARAEKKENKTVYAEEKLVTLERALRVV